MWGLYELWALHSHELAFGVWFSQGSYQLVSESYTMCLSCNQAAPVMTPVLQCSPGAETAGRKASRHGRRDCGAWWIVTIQLQGKMFSLQENSSRRFDPSMSRRTRKPKVFVENTNGFHENDLEMLSNVALENGNDSTQSSLDLCVLHQRSSLKELMTENWSRSKREEGIFRSADISRGADEKREVLEGEEKSSLAIVAKKSGFVGKYMKVLNHLIKEKGFHAKKRSMIKLPMR